VLENYQKITNTNVQNNRSRAEHPIGTVKVG